jgi:aminomethyltransferase
MPLYGHELGLETFPVQAGLGRVVNLKKEGDFVGRAAVEAEPPAEARVLVGLASEGRRAGRAGYPLFDGEGEESAEVGTITSGALSPTLGHPIAMAYVDPTLAEVGTELFIDVRGTRIPASVVSLPFYKKESR